MENLRGCVGKWKLSIDYAKLRESIFFFLILLVFKNSKRKNMKNVVLLGGSNSVMLNGLQKGLRETLEGGGGRVLQPRCWRMF